MLSEHNYIKNILARENIVVTKLTDNSTDMYLILKQTEYNAKKLLLKK
jgi:hypothetical protein